MIKISQWKLSAVVIVSIFAVLFAMPNLLDKNTRQTINQWLPASINLNTINLGLDLQGGAHLLLSIDFDEAFNEFMNDYEDQVRTALRRQNIGYLNLNANADQVSFTLRQNSDQAIVLDTLKQILPDLDINVVENNQVQITMSEQMRASRIQMMMQQSLEIIRKRIDALGTREPVIQAQGQRRIIVQVPGIDDPGQLKRTLGKTAKMTFHLLHKNFPPFTPIPATPPPGTRIVSSANPNAQNEPARYVIEKRVRVSGDRLIDAQPSIDHAGRSIVNFRFDATGARHFGEITQNNVQRYLAIVLDNQVVSAPVIREPIVGGDGQISGQFSQTEARELALVLRAGALPAPIQILEERTVGPGLGQDSIEAGKIASIIAIFLVGLYMLIYYGSFGLIANISLMLNVVLIIAIISLLQITLTLPGIAGIVLTIGMAVDANVLIFERIREEAKTNKLARAIENGFRRALTTIIDSNLTTLIASILLFAFGSGPIKGFAITLAIGICSSMFTAIMLTNLLVSYWYIKRMKPNHNLTLGF
ncbi:MAG: protein translocase subunit SecD [Pseudomonadota bacterium]